MMWTEEKISLALDGHFYVMSTDDYTTKVTDAHRGVRPAPAQPAIARPNTIDWTGKDEVILSMRRNGKQFNEIAEFLGIHKATIAWRFHRLCERMGIDASQEFPAFKKYNPAIVDDIVAGRNAGESFASIGTRLGMSKSSVHKIFYRFYRLAARKAA